MITYGILNVAKQVFLGIFSLVKSIFPQLWSFIQSSMTTISGSPGVAFAMGLLDKVIGLSFLFYVIALSFEVYVTIRLVRFLVGFFSKS